MSLLAYIILGLAGILVLLGIAGLRIVRPTHKTLVETFGKYTSIREQGLTWIFPIIQKGIFVNITERMVDVRPQTVITKDNLNAEIDAVVYYRIRDDEANVKASQYNVDNHESQLVSLARTTLRAVIGQMSFSEANEKRESINQKVESILEKETNNYGVEVLRVELQRIEAPQDVQEAMNEVVKAERIKIASTDRANATEIEADGKRRAAIKEAQGIAKGRREVADANAYQTKVEHEAAQKYFKNNAIKLKQLQTAQESLINNSKFVLGKDSKDILKLFNIGKEMED